MRATSTSFLLTSLLTGSLAAGTIRVDLVNEALPVLDNAGSPLTAGTAAWLDGAVIQIGYLSGVSTVADPGTFGAAQWNTFVPIFGGGVNGDNFSVGDAGSEAVGPFGLYNYSSTVDSDTGENLPAAYPVRLAIRFYNGTTVAGSTHFTTVSSFNSEWLLGLPSEPNPLPGDEAATDMENHTLAWQGTPFRTDLPNVAVPDLVLTDVTLTAPTTLELTWTGGDGTTDIQTSTTDDTGFATVLTGQASPATITVDPTGVTKLLVRVVEP